MNNNTLRWVSIARDELPNALFGGLRSMPDRTQFSPAMILDGRVALGYLGGLGEYRPPAALVVEDKAAAETFSWLKVYAPETAPLTQFARVMSGSDMLRLQDQGRLFQPSETRPDRWACVALGEVLAQGDGDTEVASIPLSRAAACFSSAVARAEILYGDAGWRGICIDRLRSIESDPRFVRRAVSVLELGPVWSAVGVGIRDLTECSPAEAVGLVLETVQKSATSPRDLEGPPIVLRDYPGLLSDSVEERVIEFNTLAKDLAMPRVDQRATGLVFAAAAFLVGRGTSHAFLLRRLNRSSPLSYAWFGVISSLVGPRYWDEHWSRAVKGIERGLRLRFDLADPPTVDLCWAEYGWLAATFDGLEIFNETPKILPRVLLIEIVPGVACQFRLSAGSAQTESDQRIAAISQAGREKELKDVLQQFVSLAAKSKQILEGHEPQRLNPQSALAFSEPVYKNARPKKKRNP